MNTPIALFTYNRPEHTRRTIEALLRNSEAGEHDLIIYSDAALTSDKQSSVEEVRSFIKTIKGFSSVTIHHRPHNFGLAKSIIDGVSEVLLKHETIIVLEDDMVTSPHFLSYMRDGLNRYSNDDRVISIHAYVFPVKADLPDTFFLPGADCWGWATWRRGWDIFNPDGKALLTELRRRKLLKAFDFNGAYPYSKMLEGQINGRNDSWAIRWHASAFLAGKLTLYPGRSLVHNIGNDNSGTHCTAQNCYDVELSSASIKVSSVKVIPSEVGYAAYETYLRKIQGTAFGKIRERLEAVLSRVCMNMMFKVRQ